MADDELMTVAKVLEEMGVSRALWQKLVRQSKTPPIIKIGNVQRIRRGAYREWLRENEAA